MYVLRGVACLCFSQSDVCILHISMHKSVWVQLAVTSHNVVYCAVDVCAVDVCDQLALLCLTAMTHA